MTSDFVRYLAAKKTVDDRALNRHVWDTLKTQIADCHGSICVLEVGAGIGTMIERVVDWGLFDDSSIESVRWVALDQSSDNTKELAYRLERFDLPDFLVVEPVTADIYQYIDQCDTQYDLIVAHAFLDLFDCKRLLPQLLNIVASTGLFWFTINFDGMTVFEPPIDPQLDAQIERYYHETMDTRMTDDLLSGDSHTGRHLLTLLPSLGAIILAAGSSDWVVIPQPDSTYVHDEAKFLHFIINTVSSSLEMHPMLDQILFAKWIEQRHQQIDIGKLCYLAHQLDIVGKMGQV